MANKRPNMHKKLEQFDGSCLRKNSVIRRERGNIRLDLDLLSFSRSIIVLFPSLKAIKPNPTSEKRKF